MQEEIFRKLGHELIDWIADYREGISRFPVMSQVKPGEIRKHFEASPPEKGEALNALISELERKVLPGITHWNHPSFFAYFPSNTSYSSILADLVSAGLGAQGMSWQTSPAATEIEEVMMDWLRQMLGLSSTWTGVIQDTASTATLCALLCARERTSNFSQNSGGLQNGEPPLIVYASSQGHSSIEKAALLAGFGKSNLRLIETDEEHALRIDQLEKAIVEDLKTGRRPCAVVACVGTTGSTAMDPVEPIAKLAKLHVDAAMAGSAMILPECRWMWEGVESADSIVLNPHKWLGTGFDLSAYYVRDPQHLIRVMSTNPSYLRTTQDGEVKNFRDWHIPLGRRFRALKLWFLIQSEGVEGLQARLRRDLANTQWLKAQIETESDWEILAPAHLQTICLRHVPMEMGGDESALASHNLAIAARINESGHAYVTPSILKGKQMIRISLGAETMEREQVEKIWELLREASRKV
jgi:aromatic-L-amino-acid/L-tryptophan decarboxylase